jgi:hypothetical protein
VVHRHNLHGYSRRRDALVIRRVIIVIQHISVPPSAPIVTNVVFQRAVFPPASTTLIVYKTPY